MASSCTSSPGFPPVSTTMEQSGTSNGVKDLIYLLTFEHPENTEEEFDLTQLQVVDAQEEEFDLTGLHDINDGGFTDQEIEYKLESLASNKFKATAYAAAFAAMALKEKADKPTKPNNHANDPNTAPACAVHGCKEKAYTNTHTSWCPKHEDQMIDPIRKDFLQEVSKWPSWLQDKIKAFEGIKFSVQDIHYCLFEVAVPRLKDLMSRVSCVSLKAKINDMLKAIATYKERFGLIPGVALMLLTFAVTILFAFGSVLLTPVVQALTFCAAAGTALIATVVGVGVWRNRTFFVKLGYGALIGAGVTMLAFGPGAFTAGALLGAGVTGWYLLANEKRDENAVKSEKPKNPVPSAKGKGKK